MRDACEPVRSRVSRHPDRRRAARCAGTVFAALFVGCLALVGCFAQRGRTPLQLEPGSAPADPQPWLVIAVAEPRIEMDAPRPSGMNPGAWDARNEVRRALGLIRSLRATGLYREVDFEHRLGCPADLVAHVHTNPSIPGESPDTEIMGLITFGVIPGWYTTDQGHYFTVAGDRGTRDVGFPWHHTELVGWVALPLLLWPSWTFGLDSHQAPETDEFRRYMISIDLEEIARARPEEPTPCVAG